MAVTRFAWALLLLSSRAAACEQPALALIPEKIGDDVAKVLLDVRRYSDSIIEYTACIRAELETAGSDAAPPLLRAALVARNNHAVDEHKAVTALYAERVGPLENLRLAEYLDGESRDCLFGSSVVKTGVVNEGAVLFFLRGEQAYLNVLEAACPELVEEGSFFVGNQAATGVGGSPAARGVINPGLGAPRGIDTPLSQRVCDHDRIFPFREGSARRVSACSLGRFFPVTEEEAFEILSIFDGSAEPSPAAAAGDTP
jgi:hypothetical protein